MGIGEGVEGCYKFMKIILIIVNVIVLLIGCAVLALGIFTLVSDFGVDKTNVYFGDNLYKAGSYLLIVGGAVTILIAFFGCCGAAMENRCLLGLYFAILLILILFFIAVTVVGFVFKDQVSGHVQREVNARLIEQYGIDEDFTNSWDTLQQDRKCCGMSGGKSSETSWAIFKLEVKGFQNKVQEQQYVPFSCCDPVSDQENCIGRSENYSDGRIPKAGPSGQPNMDNPSLYTEGCYDELKDFLDDNAAIIGGIALGALFIMVMAAIFAICLCKQIGSQGYVV